MLLFLKSSLQSSIPKACIQSAFITYCRTMSSIPKLDLGGIYPPIPTPFDDKEEINFTALESNVKKWNQIPFRGLTVHGSNGEYTFQTLEEKIEVVRKVRSWVSKEKLIIAGSGCESTRDTIKMSQAMASAGADAVLVVTPCYYKSGMTPDALCNHFSKVADNSPVPVLLYSVPVFTTIDLTVESAITLSKHPNIIGMKESSGNVAKIGHIVNKTKNEDFQVLAGSASYLLQSAVVGAVGGVCALANVLGEDVCRLYELVKSGDLGASSELQRRLIAPNAADAVHMDDWNFSELYGHAEKILLHQNDLPGRKPKKKQKSKKWPRR